MYCFLGVWTKSHILSGKWGATSVMFGDTLYVIDGKQEKTIDIVDTRPGGGTKYGFELKYGAWWTNMIYSLCLSFISILLGCPVPLKTNFMVDSLWLMKFHQPRAAIINSFKLCCQMLNKSRWTNYFGQFKFIISSWYNWVNQTKLSRHSYLD